MNLNALAKGKERKGKERTDWSGAHTPSGHLAVLASRSTATLGGDQHLHNSPPQDCSPACHHNNMHELPKPTYLAELNQFELSIISPSWLQLWYINMVKTK